MNQDELYIGYLKYSGKSVENGIMDVRKSGEALLGFNEILRYFLLKEDPTLSDFEFEIPVKIRKGSWDVSIPNTVIDLILAVGGIAYVKEFAKKAATDGLFETGIAKDLKKTFQYALFSVQWVIKIAKHIGTFKKDLKFNLKFKKNGNMSVVLIKNQNGELLEAPVEYFEKFIQCPEKIFSKNAKIIENDRILEIGVFEDGVEKKESINEKQKSIFLSIEEDNEIILPELEHDQFVELEGEITRATENTNTIGFRYKDHILVCKPKSGIIAQFKHNIISNDQNHFFPRVLLKGQVDRTDKNGDFKEKKPQIFFSEIIPFESDNKKLTLF